MNKKMELTKGMKLIYLFYELSLTLNFFIRDRIIVWCNENTIAA